MKSKSLLLTIAVLLGLRITAMAQTPPAYVPTDGLAGWWPFNGNANDESGNGNNGTVNGAALTEDRFGVENKAFYFNGISDFIEMNNLNILGDWSISFWHKPNILNPIVQYPIGCGIGECCGSGIGITGPNFDGISADKQIIYDGYSGQSNYLESNSSILVNYYYNVSVIKTNNTYQIYMNGILESESTSLSDIDITNLTVGKRADNFWFFNGYIDDIGIWNRALTPQEITNLFNANSPSSISSSQNEHNLNIYPNPTADRITIDLGAGLVHKNCAVTIENALGQKVYESRITQPLSDISLGELTGSGLYFVRIFDAQDVPVETRAIVVE